MLILSSQMVIPIAIVGVGQKSPVKEWCGGVCVISLAVVVQVTLLCIVCTVRADFSSPYFVVAGLSCNFLEINRSQRRERNGSCYCPRTDNPQGECS